jgi:hypothetical protein
MPPPMRNTTRARFDDARDAFGALTFVIHEDVHEAPTGIARTENNGLRAPLRARAQGKSAS